MEISRNPDYRLMASAVKYFRVLPNKKVISFKLFEVLKSSENLFEQQEAYIIMALRYTRRYPKELKSFIRKICLSRKKHWYVRAQAFLLLGQIPLSEKTLGRLRKKYDEETNIEVKRAIVVPMCQLRDEKLKDFLREISFDPNLKIGRVGRMLLDLHINPDEARKEINNLLRDYDERRLVDGLYKLEVIKHSSDKIIVDILKKRLGTIKSKIGKPILKSRIEEIIIFLGRKVMGSSLEKVLSP